MPFSGRFLYVSAEGSYTSQREVPGNECVQFGGLLVHVVYLSWSTSTCYAFKRNGLARRQAPTIIAEGSYNTAEGLLQSIRLDRM